MAQIAPDGVPTIDGCRPAVLRVMADGEERSLRSIIAAVASQMHLSDEIVAQKVSSGQGRLENRVGWACSSLYTAGLLSKARRGWYSITDDGRDVDRRNLREYSEAELVEWPQWQAYQAELQERKQRASDNLSMDLAAPANGAEDEDALSRLERLASELNAAAETELRSALQNSSPEFFELAVLKLLSAMGYGSEGGRAEHLGRTGDGGIDGVIHQDPLGLQRVYVQAKRYSDGNTVGGPEIQSFYGALRQRGADRGVFITSSRYSPAAHEAAAKLDNMVLIDGLRLTALMLEHGVGVQVRKSFSVFSVDQDFFVEE